jgi:uncharacterized caspase-like protein
MRINPILPMVFCLCAFVLTGVSYAKDKDGDNLRVYSIWPVRSQKSPDSLDVTVAFNPKTNIYHQLDCRWAKVCKTCIQISIEEALKRGGRASKTCDQKDKAPQISVKPIDVPTNEKRVALVIGNSKYVDAPLKNPVNDAQDMAKKLRGLGFEVIERNNMTTKQIGGALREFRAKLTPGSVALVFYAGHGVQIKGENYLPAVDAEIASEEDVPNQSLSMSQVMSVLDESKTRLNLVFLDACRNNPYARSFRSANNGLARITAPSGTLISYATKPGSVAADGSGRNGLYTSKLLQQMNSALQIEQTLKQVVTAVKAASDNKQEPWMEGSIEGDFCFRSCAMASLGAGVNDAERQRMEEERQKIEEEKQKLEEEKKQEDEKRIRASAELAEDRRRLDEERKSIEERQRLDEEKQKIAEERQKLEQEKLQRRLEEDRQKLVEERKRLDQELQVASLPPKTEEQGRKDCVTFSDAEKYEMGKANMARGQELYQEKAKPMSCKNCHGEAGDGRGRLGAALNPPPSSFTSCAISPQKAFNIIKNGVPGTGMVAHGKTLSGQDIWDTVKYIRSFAR